jgi:5-methylcytosine-specific restriction endonuclease McrA
MTNKERINDEMLTSLWKTYVQACEGKPYWSEGMFTLLLRDKLRCRYCNRFLFDSYEDGYYGLQCDHLLPRKYSDLVDGPSNWVLACSLCNRIKSNWDPNKNKGPQVYSSGPDGTALTEQQREELIKRSREYITERKREAAAFFSGQRQFFQDNVPWLFPDEAG